MAERSTETRNFLFAHVFLLCVVLVGFGRSFYLRGLFSTKPLPQMLTLHGIALTLWFGLAVVQGLVVLKGYRQWHRKLAWIAIPVVLAVLLSGALVNANVARQITSPRDPENMFVWGNFMSLLSFLLLVGAGVALRRRLVAHRRLMLFASLAIIGPAFARFAFWPVIGLGIVAAPIFAVGGMIVLVALAIVYDVRTLRRVQPATLAGVAGVVVPLVAGTAVALSGVAFGLLH